MILITRQRNFAPNTASLVQKAGHRALILPMLHMRYIYKAISDDNFDAIVVTSQNAVHAIKHLNWIKNKKIYAVGEKTSIKLKHFKCTNIIACDPENQNSNELIQLIQSNEHNKLKLLYLSGQEVAGDLEDNLRNLGHEVHREIVYQSIQIKELSEQAVASIHTYVTGVLFYSPRTAAAFSSLAAKYDFQLQEKTAFCISHNTAAQLIEANWSIVSVAKHSNEESLLALL